MEIFRQLGLEQAIEEACLGPAETAHFYFRPTLTSAEDFALVSRGAPA